jgi:hypothetical protein
VYSSNEQLYAVANYGIGANMDGGKSLAAMTGLPVTRDNYVTLKHLRHWLAALSFRRTVFLRR